MLIKHCLSWRNFSSASSWYTTIQFFNIPCTISQKSLCRSRLRHGILCGDCRQKNGTLISLGRLDCHNATLHLTAQFSPHAEKGTDNFYMNALLQKHHHDLYTAIGIFSYKHKRKQKGILAQNWQGLKMCYVRCKWSREVESCKKQTTVYRRQVRHSHFNFSQMMMIAMMIMMKMMLMMMMIFGPLQTYKILHTGFKVFINISPS